MLCYCKSGDSYSDCCEPIVKEEKSASDFEQLMRSRYSAFAIGNTSYLINTSSDRLLTTFSEQDLIETFSTCQFVHLDVVDFKDDTVEFIAHLLINDEYHKIHERSTFINDNNKLKYDTGLLFETPIIKLKRNDNCPCQSGKKYKKCHMD